MQPFISVIMSCYNSSEWLAESIQSILKQTYQDFEFIIVDDGSTDNSVSIMESFAKIDPRIIICKKENSGLPDSLNKGIEISRGSWIARIDCDDISEPNRLEQQLAVATSNNAIVFVGSDLLLIDAGGSTLSHHKFPTTHSALLRNLLSHKKFPPHSSALFQASAARAVGLYRSRIIRSQDWDLWLRLSEKGLLASCPLPLVRIRQHPQQITNDEHGHKSRVFNRIAVCSYLLRSLGLKDPVADVDKNFNVFHDFIKNELVKAGAYENLIFIQSINQIRIKHTQRTLKFFQIFIFSLSNPFRFSKYICYKFSQKNISKSIALRWHKYHN